MASAEYRAMRTMYPGLDPCPQRGDLPASDAHPANRQTLGTRELATRPRAALARWLVRLKTRMSILEKNVRIATPADLVAVLREVNAHVEQGRLRQLRVSNPLVQGSRVNDISEAGPGRTISTCRSVPRMRASVEHRLGPSAIDLACRGERACGLFTTLTFFASSDAEGLPTGTAR
jgi:hypothetical protein